jgi:hypothetical protein
MKEEEIKKFIQKEVNNKIKNIKYTFWVQGIIMGILISIFFLNFQTLSHQFFKSENPFKIKSFQSKGKVEIEIKFLKENKDEKENKKIKKQIFEILNAENNFILKEESSNVLYIVNSKGSNRFFENFPKQILPELEGKEKVLISLLINSFQCSESENEIKQIRLKEYFKKNSFYKYESGIIIKSIETKKILNCPTNFLKIKNFYSK